MENTPSTDSVANAPIAPLSDAQIPPETRPGDPPAEAGSAAPATTGRPRRALKVVIRLQPSAEPDYRVLLAVGGDGCDPVYRSLDADGLPTALDAIPGLVADAEERWQHAPRYPAATLPSRAKRRGTAPGEPETPVPPATGDAPSVPAAPRSTPKPAPVDQLPLF